MRYTLRHIVLFLLLLTVLASCRRELWVYTDQIHQAELITNWSKATEKPGGMTWWFMKNDHTGDYHGTTANVTHTWLTIPRGVFSGVVFDYSPAEYSHQEFVGMSNYDEALVHILPSADQPEPNDDLYGDGAVPSNIGGIARNEDTGMYVVAAEPQIMNADTLRNVVITNGYDDILVPWDEYDDIQVDSQDVLTFYAQPEPIVWKLDIKVYVRGITYMNNVTASVAGLTDGCWLGTLRHTATPCLQRLDSWTRHRMANQPDTLGYLTTTINTFGLQDLDMPRSPYDTRGASGGTRASWDAPEYNEHLRLNLKFLLRDNKTELYYHYDVDSQWITLDEGHLVITIDIPIEIGPELPYVEAADVAGFDATVTPWEDGGTAEPTF